MISERTWRHILTAPSTATAVERAESLSVSALHDSQIPWSYEELSSRSRANLRAVSRAYDVAIAGVPSDGWSAWRPTNDDSKLSYGWEDVAIPIEADKIRKTGEELGGNDAIQEGRVDPLVGCEAHERSLSAEKSKGNDGIGTERELDKNEKREAQPHKGDRNGNTPSVTEMQAAETVRHWALQAPHTPPPSEAAATIRKSSCAFKLLTTIVTEGDAPTLRATIIGAFSGDIGSTFANQVTKALILPYLVVLKTPASREMMQAVVKFAELHWRASISLFDRTNSKESINGGMAEVLVRMAAVMNAETALQCLKAFCARKWGEDGIRVVEALVAKCADEEGVAALIVASLERNVLGLEASVRFGKLLFTVTRDVPGIAVNHEQEMESILGRSKVFLAKRALKVLKEKKSKADPS